MRLAPIVLASLLGLPALALAQNPQNPMQRAPATMPPPPAPAVAETPAQPPAQAPAPTVPAAVYASPTSGSDAGPFPPLPDHGVVLNPILPASSAGLPVAAQPILSAEDAALLARLREERVARQERAIDRDAVRAAAQLAQQPRPIVEPWPGGR